MPFLYSDYPPPPPPPSLVIRYIILQIYNCFRYVINNRINSYYYSNNYDRCYVVLGLCYLNSLACFFMTITGAPKVYRELCRCKCCPFYGVNARCTIFVLVLNRTTCVPIVVVTKMLTASSSQPLYPHCLIPSSCLPLHYMFCGLQVPHIVDSLHNPL